MASSTPQRVTIHPIVLLGAIDHYNRVAKDTNKRVVGILLGTNEKGHVDVLNSYAVPFEEDEKDPSVWYLDHLYHENMYRMSHRVNAKEKVVGWYSTGPRIRKNDLAINEVVRRYTANPVLVIIDAKLSAQGIPTKSYTSHEEVSEVDSKPQMTFQHIPSDIGALESEEVGVEHLLRNVKDSTLSSVARGVQQRQLAVQELRTKLDEIESYLKGVSSGELPMNHTITRLLQDIFNLLPNLNVDEMVQAFAAKGNDAMLAVYLSSIIRAVTSLHDLIDNKLMLKARETADKAADATEVERELQNDKEVAEIEGKAKAEPNTKERK